MITSLLNLCTTNNGGRHVSVDASNDATPVDETFTFQVGAEAVSVTEHFDANEYKTVTAQHTQTSGQMFVRVTTKPSNQSKTCRLDVDAAQDCC